MIVFNNKNKLLHFNSITHEGKVVVVATDSDGNIWYTVKQDGFEDSYLKKEAKDRTGWEDWKELEFPNEAEDESVRKKEEAELTHQDNPQKFIVNSKYQSKTFDPKNPKPLPIAAVAPVQLVSAFGHVYVFRQTFYGILLVDRFVLDGMTNTLNRKLEVRFKRSKQKYQPIKSMKNGVNGLENVDTLDFRDADNQFFYEPTTQLGLINSLMNGWFSVVLMPTIENDVYRWHFFAYTYNGTNENIEITSLRASSEGLFDVKDYMHFEDNSGLPIPRQMPGITKRILTLPDGAWVTNGLAATKYDVQEEQQTDSGLQLVKKATRLMLAIPTNQGTLAFNFTVNGDGNLVQNEETSSETKILRSQQREVLLPLNTLEEITALGDTTPPPTGLVRGISASTDKNTEDLATIIAEANAGEIAVGDQVKITGNATIDGLHNIQTVDANTFEIDLPSSGGLGQWEKLEDQEDGLVFDGMISAYELTSDGKLRVSCKNHGLNAGDQVQIIGTGDYNDTYTVQKLDANQFVIDYKWVPGKAINLQTLSPNRRGVVFDGNGDYIEMPHSKAIDFQANQDFTVELWVKGEPLQDNTYWRNILSKRTSDKQQGISYDISYQLELRHFRVTLQGGGKSIFKHSPRIEDDKFHHLALVKKGDDLAIYLDGIASPDNQFTEAWSGKSEGNGPLYLGTAEQLSGTTWLPSIYCFKGEMSELRIWNVARTAADIKNNLALQLTGREFGLVGYWRLGAIAEQQVLDFSANSNHGMVHGDPYVSAKTLARKLKDGTTDVVKYTNPELFAVTQAATYEESIEFKLIADTAIDIKGNPPFSFSYWGKGSRSAEEITPFGSLVKTELEDLKNGWYRAKAQVTIPDKVSLLRSFEIDKIQGNWDKLELRKHRIRLIWDSISEQSYNVNVTLEKVDNLKQDKVDTILKQIDPKEQLESALLKEKSFLEQEIASLNSAISNKADAITNKELEIQQQNAKIQDKRTKLAASNDKYVSEEQNSLNYWCKLQCNASEKDNYMTRVYTQTGELLSAEDGEFNNYYFKFEAIGDGYYLIKCEWDDRVLSADIANNIVKGLKEFTKSHQAQWKPEQVKGEDYFVIRNRSKQGDTFVLTLGGGKFNVQIFPYFGIPSPLQKWKLQSIGVKSNNNIANAWTVWSDLNNEVNKLNTQLKKLNDELNRLKTGDLDAELKKRNDRLIQVKNELTTTQTELNKLNTDFLREFKILNNPPGTRSHSDYTATLLPFVKPDSRLNALATSEGNVQLSYFDSQGRMRLTNYDAEADKKNSTFEQWRPDGFRTCLVFGSNHYLELEPSLMLTEDWTIEAWFSYPLPPPAPGNVSSLTVDNWAKGGMETHIGIFGNELVAVFDINKQAVIFYSGFNMNELSNGWHHLAAVGQGSNTLFYIDGVLKGNLRATLEETLKINWLIHEDNDLYKKEVEKLKNQKLKTNAPIHFIGHGFGKLAEVRIWGLALSEEEIAVNSKSLLTGNEPGLLAYFPFNEGHGEEVNNLVLYGTGAKLVGASWWACTAPIGNPGHKVMQFDGIDDYIEVPYAPGLNPAQFTIACWVKVTGGQGTYRSVVTSRNTSPQTSGYMIYAGDNNKWQFWVGNPSQWDTLAGTEIVLHQWTHLAATFDGSNLTLYLNGELKAKRTATYIANGQKSLRIGAGSTESAAPRYFFPGQIAEFSVWNTPLSPDKIKATIHKSLDSVLAAANNSLTAYFPLDEVKPGNTVDDLKSGKTGTVKNNAKLVDDISLPLAADALVTSEYSTVSKDKVAIMRRFFGFPVRNGAMFLPDQRIEALELKWIGNAQFAPTLLGYIEGAPPVPSENMTFADDYNGASSVELATSEDMEFNWTRSQDSGLGASVDLFLGGGGEVSIVAAPLGVGSQVLATKAKGGFKGDLELSYQFLNESSITSSSSLSMTDKLELRGVPEEQAKFPHLGIRFVPKNIGYALVVSALADVFITRLARSKKMIGYQVQPVEGIPPDVNTITFMMNPAYTMNGSLDGLTGSSATSDRFFRHVPDMRAQYGSHYPASYYRLKEAYVLKQAIEEEDKRREAYFMNFNVGLVDETSLNRNIDTGDVSSTISNTREEDKVSTDPNLTKEQINQAKADQQNKQAENFNKEVSAKAEQTSAATKAKQAEIESKIKDLEKREHATTSFAGWQKKMEDLQIRSGKRNIVNTYVWDADGGLRTQTQSFANTVEHTIGGSFSLNAGLGGAGEFDAGPVSVELTILATVNMTQTMTKTHSSSKGMELNVDLSGMEFRGVTDFRDNPIVPGEKVDRYRFMSFYLEGSTQNFQDFFTYVVDPEWLASNDEEARALRQTQSGKPNKTWRVLHRVTYVERPALMDFGRASRPLTIAESSDYQLIFDKLAALQEDMKLLLKKGD